MYDVPQCLYESRLLPEPRICRIFDEQYLQPRNPLPTESVPSAPLPTEPVPSEPETNHFGDAYTDYIYVAYADQIARYHTALSEKWDENKYLENNMSAQPYSYYEGNPLDNVGFGFVDLDNDDSLELVIGAIANAEQAPYVFEIWTLVGGEPVMLVQSSSENHCVLEYAEEDNMWYVVSEISLGAGNHATYYFMLTDGNLEIMQGIVFDASADAQNPWFLTYDMDSDVSNDEPIDENMANAILESNRKLYTAIAYFPYAWY